MLSAQYIGAVETPLTPRPRSRLRTGRRIVRGSVAHAAARARANSVSRAADGMPAYRMSRAAARVRKRPSTSRSRDTAPESRPQPSTWALA